MLVSVVIVSYNSFKYLEWAIPILNDISVIQEVIIVDNGSSVELEKIKKLSITYKKVKVYCGEENVGFSRANNIGVELASPVSKYILFLNPDASIDETNLNILIDRLDKDSNLVAVSSMLRSFNFESKEPLVSYDSLGIYKRGLSWRDIVDYEDININDGVSYPDALCGALILTKRETIDNVLERHGYFFNPCFFMYKEDIELSMRLRELGRIAIVHDAIAFHCRGWTARRQMSKMARIHSAKNEVVINYRYSKASLPYSVFKYIYVLIFEDSLIGLLQRLSRRYLKYRL